MIKYLDLTKLFIRSLRINKSNKTKGKFFFYSFITLTVLFVFIPVLFIYTAFIINTMTKLNEVDFAPFGFEALLFIISMFSFVFGFNVLINELYFSEDIENILPLPVKPEVIVASKFTSCFLIENVILFIFLILAVVAYVIALKLPASYILLSLPGIIFLPMIPLVICTIILFLTINLLKRFLTTKSIKKIGYILVAILVSIVAYILWKLSTFNFEEFIINFAAGDHTFLEVMKYIFPSVFFFTKGLNEGSFIYIFLSILISLIYFGIMLILAKKIYYNSVVGITSKDTGSKKSSYNKISNFKVNKPENSYFLKDVKTIFRSPTFFINCILINIIWPIFVFLIFRIALPNYTIEHMRTLVSNGDNVFFFRMLLMILIISIIIPAFNSLASAAFSREGKNYHFIKYIPMKYGIQWRIKYLISFVLSFLGIMIYALPFFLIIRIPISMILLYILITSLSISLVTLIGLLIDSAFTKLIWDDEADSLRENYNTFIAMGYSVLLLIILGIGGYYLFDHNIMTVNELIITSLAILTTGNLLLYLISNKKISKNIISQEV